MLALDLIRRQAEREGHAVGPILVLSYKNHALDEFLIDVLNQYKSPSYEFRRLMHYNDHSSLRPGMMIRTGNPEIESLERFKEKYSSFEMTAKENLQKIVQVQRNANSVIKELHECVRYLETTLDVKFIEKKIY